MHEHTTCKLSKQNAPTFKKSLSHKNEFNIPQCSCYHSNEQPNPSIQYFNYTYPSLAGNNCFKNIKLERINFELLIRISLGNYYDNLSSAHKPTYSYSAHYNGFSSNTMHDSSKIFSHKKNILSFDYSHSV